MKSSERRAAAIRLLAEIDQREREEASIAADSSMASRERRWARAYRDFYRRSAARVERLIAALEADT